MNEYINRLLAEMKISEPVHDVVRNINDEPILYQ